jgi:hypothetical protein
MLVPMRGTGKPESPPRQVPGPHPPHDAPMPCSRARLGTVPVAWTHGMILREIDRGSFRYPGLTRLSGMHCEITETAQGIGARPVASHLAASRIDREAARVPQSVRVRADPDGEALR